jgi:two-component system cell cycle response regulator CtrA
MLDLDFRTMAVTRGNMTVHLTGKEYAILALLAARPGLTTSKEMILNHLYGGVNEPEIKIIDIFVCRLRRKLRNVSNGADYIETVWGRGYVFAEPRESVDVKTRRIRA